MAKVKVKPSQLFVTDKKGLSPFMEALRAVRKLPVSARTFYWLNKLSVVLEKEFADYEAARVNLVMLLGQKTETGCEVPAEKQAEFFKQMAELDDDIELPIEDTVKLDLPASGVADDWYLLMAAMDIFAEPK